MGGCAGKPREVDLDQDEQPIEAPATPKQAEGEQVKENNEGGESEKKEEDAPLVDLSVTKEEAKAEPSSEPPVSTEPAATEAEKPKEETVVAKPEDTKVEAVKESPAEPAKEDQVAAKDDRPLAPPTSED
ncbi:pollen-specific leucine-rich repeat extensin-like protein 1 [Quillaja saponaria]|uniref:Pollen-specific leucine-rich repeat extensin-like protein 1 n=1 Tax=Quillaja saponaria TaxID=32244 RepID=A0AAD7LJY1_QUISA|nr:pollen-specific leucine-rich repeat extensin-like protein 1 [Quillaja saponaria]